MDNKLPPLYIVLGVVLILLAGGIGFFVGGTINPTSSNPAQTIQQAVSGNSVFTSQSAYVQGQVTAVNGSQLTVKNSANNQTATFQAANTMYITKFSNGPRPASPSTDLKTLELNTPAVINLELRDGSYQVVSVSYLPPVSSTPTPSSTPR